MKIQKSWFTAVPAFVIAAACADAPTAAAINRQVAQVGAVSATVVTDCQAQIDALRDRTVATVITGKNAERERAGLVKILTDANALLDVGKNTDAVKKLTDYIVKVEQLEAAGRLAPTDGEALIADANSAIACINGISAG